MVSSLPLIPTTIVGSYPQPRWLVDHDAAKGLVRGGKLRRQRNRSLQMAARLDERARPARQLARARQKVDRPCEIDWQRERNGRLPRERDRLVLGPDAHERDDRAEDLVAHDGHRVIAVGEDRGLEELPGPGDPLAAADDPNSETKKGQICEANFYTGELALLKGTKDDAIRLFRLAASGCPHGFVEWDGANAELKALGVRP